MKNLLIAIALMFTLSSTAHASCTAAWWKSNKVAMQNVIETRWAQLPGGPLVATKLRCITHENSFVVVQFTATPALDACDYPFVAISTREDPARLITLFCGSTRNPYAKRVFQP